MSGWGPLRTLLLVICGVMLWVVGVTEVGMVEHCVRSTHMSWAWCWNDRHPGLAVTTGVKP